MITNARKTALSLFILGLASANVYADAVNYSGSDCVRRAGGAIAYDFHGGVYNTSNTTNAYVLCHVPHTDFDGFLNPGEIDSGYYEAVDLHSSRNVACRFRSHALNSNGSIYRHYGSMGYTTGFGTHGQTANLGGIPERSDTAYVLACDIPPTTSNGASKVYTYRVNQ